MLGIQSWALSILTTWISSFSTRLICIDWASRPVSAVWDSELGALHALAPFGAMHQTALTHLGLFAAAVNKVDLRSNSKSIWSIAFMGHTILIDLSTPAGAPVVSMRMRLSGSNLITNVLHIQLLTRSDLYRWLYVIIMFFHRYHSAFCSEPGDVVHFDVIFLWSKSFKGVQRRHLCQCAPAACPWFPLVTIVPFGA